MPQECAWWSRTICLVDHDISNVMLAQQQLNIVRGISDTGSSEVKVNMIFQVSTNLIKS